MIFYSTILLLLREHAGDLHPYLWTCVLKEIEVVRQVADYASRAHRYAYFDSQTSQSGGYAAGLLFRSDVALLFTVKVTKIEWHICVEQAMLSHVVGVATKMPIAKVSVNRTETGESLMLQVQKSTHTGVMVPLQGQGIISQCHK